MTTVTVDLPDELAAYLLAQPSPEAWVARALRRSLRLRAPIAQILAAHGLPPFSAEGAAWARVKLYPDDPDLTAAERTAAARFSGWLQSRDHRS